jgi:tyrosyl-tRNA synthetase
VMPLYFEVLTDVPSADLAEMRAATEAGSANPRDFKMRLAREVVREFINSEAAAEAEADFKRRFQEREVPADMPLHRIAGPTNIIDVLVDAGLAPSRGEARRLIAGGGVRLDGEKIEGVDATVQPDAPHVLQVGRRRWARIVGS